MTARRWIKPRGVFIDAQNIRTRGADVPDSTRAAANQAGLFCYRELGTGATIITCMLLRLDTLVTTTTSPSYASLFERGSGDRPKGEPLETAPNQRTPAEEAKTTSNIVYVTVVMLPFVNDVFQSLGVGLDELRLKERPRNADHFSHCASHLPHLFSWSQHYFFPVFQF